MKAPVLIIVLYIAVLITAQNTTTDEFPSLTEKCFQQERVPQHYKANFHNFQYADNEIVHKYIRCVSSGIQLWHNTNGFNQEKIAQHYGDRASEETILPIISKCNSDNQNSNNQLWCYRAFLCILNSQVGEWFKDDVLRKRKSYLENGHH